MWKFVVGCVLWLWLSSLSSGGSVREKRELRFPKGGSFVAGVALASFLPKGPTDGLAHVLEFDLGFPFPEEFAVERADASFESPKGWKRHNKRRGKRHLEDQRRGLLSKLEEGVKRLGLNGSSCVRRFRCELRTISPESSLAEELLAALFEPSPREDCHLEANACPVSLLHAILHSHQI